jgi:hypothetical protein
MNNKLFNFAERYIKAGFCPIPTWPDRRKNPRLSSITEYRDRLPTLAEWAKWATSMPNSNIALITGYHKNLCCLDFDSIADYNGWLISVAPGWKNTWTVETGRGRHVYFFAQGETGHDRMFTRGNLEVLLRSKGAYVIVPPSIHHTGKPYRTIINTYPVTTRVSWILSGWEEKKPDPKKPPIPIGPGKIAISDSLNILDYIPTYKNTPNKKGAYLAFCPFHDDDHPSAWVNPDENRFGCNACYPGYWLDVVNVIAIMQGRPNNEVMRELYQKGLITPQRQK